MISLIVNEKTVEVDVAPDTPLLWVLRDQLQLTGTKYSCGIGECGACTVHIDNEAVRSCQVPVQEVAGKKITTIEGLPESHPVKAAWVAEEVPQCGYCQPGHIMQATAFLAKFPQPTDADIDKEMTGICRCGTYPRIRSAIHRAAKTPAKAAPAAAAAPAPAPAAAPATPAAPTPTTAAAPAAAPNPTAPAAPPAATTPATGGKK